MYERIGDAMKRSWVIGAVVGVLVIAAAGVGYAAFRVNERGNEQDRAAEVVVKANLVDDELSKVWAKLDKSDREWDLAVQGSDTTDLSTTLASTRDTAESLKEDVTEIRALIEDIPSPAVREAYAKACDQLDAALDKAIEQAAVAEPYCQASAVLIAALENERVGWSEVNESIRSCNADDWTAGKDHATSATAQFQAMRDAYTQAFTLSGRPEVEDAYPYADACLELARLQHELAVIGARGGVNSYNAQIEKTDAQSQAIAGMEDLQSSGHRAVWMKADEVYGHFGVLATDAKFAWNAAKEMVAAGDV